MVKRICVLRMAFLPYLIPPVRQFLAGLRDRSYAITVIKSHTRDRNAPADTLEGVRFSMISLLAKRLPKSKLMEPLVFLEFILRSTFRALRARPDLVIAVDLDSLLQGWVVSRLRRVPLVYYSIELYAERPGFSPKWFWIWFERRLINRADLVVACEPNRARVMQEKYGARRLPLTVLNVPPYSEPKRTDTIPKCLRQHGVENQKIAFYMGEISRARCMDQFIEAARLLDEGIVMFFIGRVSSDYDIARKIRECGVEHKVFVHPPVHPDEVMPFACSAHLGLQTQVNDGLNHLYCAPIKLFQYLMAGLPVIASNFPGMIEVVEQNGAGLCVDPLDSAGIARAVNTILGDPETWNRMSANALRVAKEKYCYEVESKKLFDAVGRLLGDLEKSASP